MDARPSTFSTRVRAFVKAMAAAMVLGLPLALWLPGTLGGKMLAVLALMVCSPLLAAVIVFFARRRIRGQSPNSSAF